MELPLDWIDVLQSDRTRPSPSDVISVTQNIVKQWDVLLAGKYVKKCPFPTRQIKEIECSREHSKRMKHRSAFHATWSISPIVPSGKKTTSTIVLEEGEFELPLQASNSNLIVCVLLQLATLLGLIPIKTDKYKHLMLLKRFCGPAAPLYYTELPQQ
ncbi:hypothetical protein QE152_g8602 [Popillia japonica]|uniref:Uncharacterized protein n=1 Tax=Popillia japonica TaxID=7064 RepID=A0AAW1M1D8_POPJA